MAEPLSGAPGGGPGGRPGGNLPLQLYQNIYLFCKSIFNKEIYIVPNKIFKYFYKLTPSRNAIGQQVYGIGGAWRQPVRSCKFGPPGPGQKGRWGAAGSRMRNDDDRKIGIQKRCQDLTLTAHEPPKSLLNLSAPCASRESHKP